MVNLLVPGDPDVARREGGLSAQSNQDAYDRTRALVAGGGSSNMRNAGTPVPLVVSSAAGCRLRDVEGNELLDLNMGYGPHLFGYGDQEVLGALAAQLGSATMTGLPHALDQVAAGLVVDLVPSIEQLRFANSGTEAVASSIRLARALTGRAGLVTFEGHYHGWSEALLRVPATPDQRPAGARRPLGGAPGMIPRAHADTWELRFNDAEGLDALFRQHGEHIAAVILEPVCANAGVVLPAEDFLEGVVAVAHRYGALVVFDEVITGFRLAAGGAQELYGVSPDITVLSKAIGGGFPVAAFGASRQIMEPLAENRAVHAGVYAGNHLAMRAVAASLTKIADTPHLYQTLDLRAAHLEHQVRAAFAAAGVPVRVTRSGSVMSVGALHHGADDDLATDCAVDRLDFETHRRLQMACQRRGLYFHPNPLEPWFISTAHEADDIDEAAQVLRSALSEL